jgi:hypothetical protein
MHFVTDGNMVRYGTPIEVRQPCIDDCPNHGNGDTVWYLVVIPADPFSDPPGLADRYWACSGLAPDDFDALRPEPPPLR